MKFSKVFDIPNEDSLQAAVAELKKNIRAGEWVWLKGELGAGKTTFVRHYLKSLGYEGPVSSPSYPLLLEYETSVGRFVHVDCYRLNAQSPLPWDWREWDGAFVFAEWPEQSKLPLNRFSWQISLEPGSSEISRKLTLLRL